MPDRDRPSSIGSSAGSTSGQELPKSRGWPAQGVPGSLVVPARRDRAVLLRRAVRHRRLPDLLLHGRHAARHLRRSVRAARGAEVSAAFDSVMRLSFDVRAGLLMRQVHHWAALVFLAAIVVHASRVFFTGAFRRPREINWLIGVRLLLMALAAGITGYSLPDDLLSGTGLRIVYSVVLSIPFMGPWLAYLVFGGDFPTDELIGRLYVFHIMLLPLLMIGTITVHLGDPVAAEAHPVPRRAGDRGQGRRAPPVARPGVPLRRPPVRDRRRPGPVGRSRPDQSGLGLRTVRAVSRGLAGAARLVCGLARGCSSARARAGSRRSWA